MNVSAKDKGTGKEQKIRIEASSGLSDEEIEKMKKEAQANAETYKIEKEKVEKLNSADALIFQTEKQLKDYGDKISEGNKKPIDEALTKLKEAHSSGDLAAIDTATEALNKVWESASQEIYAAQAQANAEASSAGPGQEASEKDGKTDQDVSDVEYEEVDDKK